MPAIPQPNASVICKVYWENKTEITVKEFTDLEAAKAYGMGTMTTYNSNIILGILSINNPKPLGFQLFVNQDVLTAQYFFGMGN